MRALKAIVTLGLLDILQPLSATTCTTIASGDFMDPSIWSCGHVPVICDTLIAAHAVTFSGDLLLAPAVLIVRGEASLDIEGHLTISRKVLNDGRISGSQVTFLADTLFNNGLLLVRDTLRSEENNTTYNPGTITAGYGWAMNIFHNSGRAEFERGLHAVFLTNSSELVGDGTFAFYAAFSNWGPAARLEADSIFMFNEQMEIQGTVVADSVFYVGNAYTNGGIRVSSDAYIISHGDFYNYGSVTGDGHICVARRTENHGMMEWINICDATPPASAPYLDVNDGALWNSVDFCEDGACSVVGLAEHPIGIEFDVWPVPATESVLVRLPAGRSADYLLTDAQGRTVQRGKLTGMARIQRPLQGSGTYHLTVQCAEGRGTRTIMFE